MALSDAILSQLIIANMGTLGSDNAEVNKSYDEGIKKLADAIASAVVSHITSSAMVTTQVVGTSPSGAVTGTGTGTIS